MTSKKRIAELLNKWFRREPCNKLYYIHENDIDNYLTTITVDGKAYSVYLGGNDEMFDGDEFYQLGITQDGKVYEFYFDTEDENGDNIPLDEIDYTKAYRMKDVTRYADDFE